MAGQWLNKENLRFLARLNPAWTQVEEDVAHLEAYLGHELGPMEADHYIHRNYTSTIFFKWRKGEKLEEEMVRCALLRNFLG